MNNGTDVKKYNLLSAVSVLAKAHVATKADLAKTSGCTTATANTMINQMLRAQVVVEEGIAKSNGGRKAALYKLNTQKFRIIGVAIGLNVLKVSVLDLCLNLLQTVEMPCDVESLSPNECIEQICATVQSIISKHQASLADIIGIGITVPGTVDYENGVVHHLPNAKAWKNVSIKKALETRMHIPVYVDNDNNAIALTLKWTNQTDENTNAVYLNTMEGIGSGILLDGKIYRGRNGMAGEFGHVSIDINGPQCKCGNHGCVELFAADTAAIKRAAQHDSLHKSLLWELCGQNASGISLDLLLKAAKQNDTVALSAFEETAKYLAVCFDMVLKAFSPETIIVDSKWLGEQPKICDRLFASVGETSNVRLELNQTKDLQLLSPGTLVLDAILTETESNRLLDAIESM